MWDSEYAVAPFIKLTKGIEADFLMRLRPNRCLWRDSSTYEKKETSKNMNKNSN